MRGCLTMMSSEWYDERSGERLGERCISGWMNS